MDDRPVIEAVDAQRLIYDACRREWPRWLGVPMLKNPLDLAVYAEILYEVRPRLIVETGTAFGGSALYLAHCCDALGEGRVISIDLPLVERGVLYLRTAARHPWLAVEALRTMPKHPRVTYLSGNSTGPLTLAHVRAAAAEGGPVLVMLDSDHRAAHVRAECDAYGDLVTPGSYLIVEDTNGLGYTFEGEGPAEAVRDFLRDHPEFAPDRARERFGVTFNPGGFLRRRP